MDILGKVHPDRASRELDGVVDNHILQNADKRNSLVEYASRIGSCGILSTKDEFTPNPKEEVIPSTKEVAPSTKDEVTPSTKDEVTPSTKDEVTPSTNDEVTPSTNDEVTPSTKDEIMFIGYPSLDGIFEEYGFVGSFNTTYGVSNWVCERLTSDQINRISLTRKDYSSGFYEDNEANDERRTALADYHGSGYNRGHMAAAGNHAYSYQAYKGTFCLRNIAPMYTNVNLILSRIEKQGQHLAKDQGEVYCITGTIFHKERELTFLKEGCKVAIPDAFFKVLVCKGKHNNYETWSFRIENTEDVVYKDIMAALVKLDDIKKETGLNLLCNVPNDKIMENCKKIHKRARGNGS